MKELRVEGPIVIVEDDPWVLELLRDVLNSEGCTVVSCSHPRRLERLLAAIQPALFLIDLMLPMTDGLSLGRQLREQGYIDTPMVAMSASVARLTLASRSGIFDDTLPKPFDVTQLVDVIQRLATGASRAGSAVAG